MISVSFQPQQQQATTKQAQLSGKVSEGSQSPFQSLLNQTIMSQDPKLTTMIASNLKGENFLSSADIIPPTTNLDEASLLGDVIVLFEQLAEQVPLMNGFLQLDESTKNVLSGLPDELKSELMALFETRIPVEELINNYEQTESPLELIALLLFFNEKQSIGQIQLSNAQQQTLTHYVQHLMKHTNDEMPPEMKQLFNRLLQTNELSQPNKGTQTTHYVEQTILSKQETSSQGLSLQTFSHDQTTMSRAQQMTIHVGEHLTKEAEQHQFQRQFQEMMNRGLFRNLQNGLNQLSIKLYPEHLGRLDIQITQLNGIITARIMASTQIAKDLIEGQLQQLRQAFTQQQLQVERIEVTQQEQAPLYQSARDEQSKEQQNQRAREERKGTQEENESFSELLEEFTFMEEV